MDQLSNIRVLFIIIVKLINKYDKHYSLFVGYLQCPCFTSVRKSVMYVRFVLRIFALMTIDCAPSYDYIDVVSCLSSYDFCTRWCALTRSDDGAYFDISSPMISSPDQCRITYVRIVLLLIKVHSSGYFDTFHDPTSVVSYKFEHLNSIPFSRR